MAAWEGGEVWVFGHTRHRDVNNGPEFAFCEFATNPMPHWYLLFPVVGSAVVCHGRAAGGIENEIGWKIDGRAEAIYDSLGGRFLENALGNYWWKKNKIGDIMSRYLSWDTIFLLRLHLE